MFVPGMISEKNLLDELFSNDFFSDEPLGKKDVSLMKTDIKMEDGNYKMEIDLPGYKKEDISAELNDGILIIKAETKEEHDEKDEKGNYIRRERHYGSCRRSYFVGEDVTEEEIKASFENGVLKVDFPAKAEHHIKEEDKKMISIN